MFKIPPPSIILSDLDVHKEQNFKHSIFFKKNSYEDLAKKILYSYKKFESGPDLKIEQISAIENKKLMRKFAKQFISLSNF